MQRLLTVAAVLVAAVSVSVMLFVALAWTMTFLLVTFEGYNGDCWWANCGPVSEFTRDHDRFVIGSMALAAALPPAVLLWKARRVFTDAT